MAREYLFRAKSKDNGEWVYGDFIHSWHKKQTKSMPMIYNNMGKFEVDRETVCEYTGLQDKFGTKIFEGDIVKMYLRDDVIVVGDIRYSENDCRFKFFEDFLYPYGFDNTTPIEVIGNKFDNPELLEVQDEQAN